LKFHEFCKSLDDQYHTNIATSGEKYDSLELQALKKEIGQQWKNEFGTQNTNNFNTYDWEGKFESIINLSGIKWYSDKLNFIKMLRSGRGDTEMAYAIYFWFQEYSIKNEDIGNLEYPYKHLALTISQFIIEQDFKLNSKNIELADDENMFEKENSATSISKDVTAKDETAEKENGSNDLDNTDAQGSSVYPISKISASKIEKAKSQKRFQFTKKHLLLGVLFSFLVTAYFTYEIQTENTTQQIKLLDQTKKYNQEKTTRLIEKAEKLLEEKSYRLAVLLTLKSISEYPLKQIDELLEQRALSILKKSIGHYIAINSFETQVDTKFIDVTSDFKYVLVANDRTLAVFETKTGKQLYLKALPRNVKQVSFSTSENRILVTTAGLATLPINDATPAKVFYPNKSIVYDKLTGQVVKEITHQSSLFKFLNVDNDTYIGLFESDEYLGGSLNFFSGNGDIKSNLFNDKFHMLMDVWLSPDKSKMVVSGTSNIALIELSDNKFDEVKVIPLEEKLEYSGQSILSKDGLSFVTLVARKNNPKDLFEAPMYALYPGKITDNLPIQQKKPLPYFDDKANDGLVSGFDEVNISTSGKFLSIYRKGENKIFLYDLLKKRFHKTINVSGNIVSAHFSPDESKILVNTHQKEIYLFDIESAEVAFSSIGGNYNFNTILRKPIDGVGFAGQSSDFFSIDRTGIFKKFQKLKLPSGGKVLANSNNINSIVLSKYSGIAAIASLEGNIELYDVTTNSQKSILHGHTGQVSHISFIENDTKLLSASRDGRLKVWDINSGRLLKTVNLDERIDYVFQSKDHNHFLAFRLGGDDFSMWEINKKNEEINDIQAHKVTPKKYSNTQWIENIKNTFPSGIMFFQKVTNRYIKKGEGSVNFLLTSFSTSEHLNIKAYIEKNISETNDQKNGNTIYLRYLDTNEKIRLTRVSSKIRKLELSPDGRMLMIFSNDSVQIWDTSTRQIIKSFNASSAVDFKFSANSQFLFGLLNSETIVVFDMKKSELVFKYNTANGVKNKSLNMSHDSSQIYWIQDDGRVFISPISKFSDADLIDHFKTFDIPPLTEQETEKLNI